jgi:SAM-dependent methyltransferase
MTKTVSEDLVAYWNGPGADRWTAYQERLDRALAPFGHEAIVRGRIQKGERVLDVGCGCGATLLELAETVGREGRVVGVDVSEPMLAQAKARAKALPQVETRVGDAAALTLDAPVDVLFSRFGVMFFADAARAFANLARALVPGGRAAFVCWRALAENPWMTVPLGAIAPFFPEAAAKLFPPDEPGPFAFADAEKVKGVLGAAGFGAVRVEPFDADVVLSEASLDEAVEFGVSAGPGSRLLLEADEATRAAAREAVRAALAPRATERSGVRLRGATWIVTGRRVATATA